MLTDERRIAPAAHQALDRLLEGNRRFVNGEAGTGAPQRAALAELVGGQRPYAAVLGCSDSRVPPELVFDSGLGELFVVRVPGGVLSDEVLGSVQYATWYLGTPLVVVLGHDDCGAVKAALATRRDGTRHRPHVQALVDAVVTRLPDPDPASSPRGELAHAVVAQVRWAVDRLVAPDGPALAREHRTLVVGAVYDLASGEVRILEQVEESAHRTS